MAMKLVLVTSGAGQGAGLLARKLGLPTRLPRMPAPLSRAAPRASMARPSAAGSVTPHSAMGSLLVFTISPMVRKECGRLHRFRANAAVSQLLLDSIFDDQTTALQLMESMRPLPMSTAVCVPGFRLAPCSAGTHTAQAALMTAPRGRLGAGSWTRRTVGREELKDSAAGGAKGRAEWLTGGTEFAGRGTGEMEGRPRSPLQSRAPTPTTSTVHPCRLDTPTTSTARTEDTSLAYTHAERASPFSSSWRCVWCPPGPTFRFR